MPGTPERQGGNPTPTQRQEDDLFRTSRQSGKASRLFHNTGNAEATRTSYPKSPFAPRGGDGVDPESASYRDQDTLTDWDQSDNERLASPTPAPTNQRVPRTPQRRITRARRVTNPAKRREDAKLGEILRAMERAHEANERRFRELAEGVSLSEKRLEEKVDSLQYEVSKIQNGLNITLRPGGNLFGMVHNGMDEILKKFQAMECKEESQRIERGGLRAAFERLYENVQTLEGNLDRSVTKMEKATSWLEELAKEGQAQNQKTQPPQQREIPRQVPAVPTIAKQTRREAPTMAAPQQPKPLPKPQLQKGKEVEAKQAAPVKSVQPAPPKKPMTIFKVAPKTRTFAEAVKAKAEKAEDGWKQVGKGGKEKREQKPARMTPAKNPPLEKRRILFCRDNAIPPTRRTATDILSAINRALYAANAEPFIRVMDAKFTEKGNCSAVTTHNSTAEMMGRYRDVVLKAARTQDEGIIDFGSNEPWKRVKVHGVALERYVGKGTYGTGKLKEELEAENEGLVIPLSIRWLGQLHNIKQRWRAGEIKASSVTFVIRGNDMAAKFIKSGVRICGRIHETVEFVELGPDTQCQACSGWGHLESNCAFPGNPRCSLCAGGHRTENHACSVTGCQAKKGATCAHLTTKCPNCRGPHTALYRGCTEKMEAMRKAREWREECRRGGVPTTTPEEKPSEESEMEIEVKATQPELPAEDDDAIMGGTQPAPKPLEGLAESQHASATQTPTPTTPSISIPETPAPSGSTAILTIDIE